VLVHAGTLLGCTWYVARGVLSTTANSCTYTCAVTTMILVELLEEALAIRQRLLGPTHLQCSSILNQLGKLHCSSGMYAKSKQAVRASIDRLIE